MPGGGDSPAGYGLLVPERESFARLPDQISLSREEVATVLFALDLAEVSAPAAGRQEVRRAIRLLTSKLWPELGDLLGDDEA